LIGSFSFCKFAIAIYEELGKFFVKLILRYKLFSYDGVILF